MSCIAELRHSTECAPMETPRRPRQLLRSGHVRLGLSPDGRAVFALFRRFFADMREEWRGEALRD